MNTIGKIFWIFVLGASLLPAAGQEKPAAKKAVDYDYLLPWDGKGSRGPQTKEGEAMPPFQLFDNVYYVGPKSTSVYVLKTDKGLILIDTALDYTTDIVLDNIRAIGLDPKDIKYIIVTHGHWDHTAGIKAIQAASGARVGMSAEDWKIYETPDPKHAFDPIAMDLVLKEGDTIKLGKTIVEMHLTPSNTLGCISLVYTVYDHGKPYRAISLGGTGFNFPPEWNQNYIHSMERMRAVPDIQVMLPDHQQINDIFELEEKAKSRKPGDTNPFVIGRAAVVNWFDTIIKLAKDKERMETAAMKQ
jgi:metallo-beta-lactamase class B